LIAILAALIDSAGSPPREWALDLADDVVAAGRTIPVLSVGFLKKLSY